MIHEKTATHRPVKNQCAAVKNNRAILAHRSVTDNPSRQVADRCFLQKVREIKGDDFAAIVAGILAAW